jgi:PIN domain nuclease of toxin-antitoxin system
VRVLLDTHTFLWYSAGDSQLSEYARSIIEDSSNDCLLSTASVIELAIKYSLGRLTLTHSFQDYVSEGLSRLNCNLLGLTLPQLAQLSSLPFHHRDPFDRMIAAQAIVEAIDVVSIDKAFDLYGVKRHW